MGLQNPRIRSIYRTNPQSVRFLRPDPPMRKPIHSPPTRFLQYLNTRHPNINFTTEFEENHEIPFLDVRVKRNLNTFTTTVHCKTTFTGLYTKWDSFTPRKYKINLIRTLTYRCLRICSSSSSLQSALFDLIKEDSPSEWLPERRALLQH